MFVDNKWRTLKEETKSGNAKRSTIIKCSAGNSYLYFGNVNCTNTAELYQGVILPDGWTVGTIPVTGGVEREHIIEYFCPEHRPDFPYEKRISELEEELQEIMGRIAFLIGKKV